MINLIRNNEELLVVVDNTFHYCDIDWERTNNNEIIINTFFDIFAFPIDEVIVSYKFQEMVATAIIVNNIVIEIPIYYQLKKIIKTNEYTNKLTKYANKLS
jgi:hypothetical protein